MKDSRLTSDTCHATINNVIATFEHKGLKKFFEGNPRYIERRAPQPRGVHPRRDGRRRVDIRSKLPGFRLPELSGDLKGIWSITVSGNWRITFRFEDGEFHDVDLVDYH